MAEAHVVQKDLIKVGPQGTPIQEGEAINARIQFSTEHRVLMNPNVPNTYAVNAEGNKVPTYPTIEAYIVAEAAAGFILRHMDQYTIVTST